MLMDENSRDVKVTTTPPVWDHDRAYAKGDEVLIGVCAYRAKQNVLKGTGFFRYAHDSCLIVHPDWEFTRHVPPPSPTPAPTCDAPHCGCAEGEDCAANGAGDPVRPAWTITRVDEPGRDAMLRLSDGREVIQFRISEHLGYEAMKEVLHSVWRELECIPIISKPRAQPFDVRPDAVNVLPPGMRVQTTPSIRRVGNDLVVNDGHGNETVVGAPPAPDLAARLDGLKASLDALAERLERGPATGTEDDPVPVKVGHKINSSLGSLGLTTWVGMVDLRRVGPGRYVRDQHGHVAQVCSMTTDTDGTSRLSVDVVDGEG